MRCFYPFIVGLFCLSTGNLAAQGVVGTAFTRYMVNAPSTNSVGLSSPIPATSMTDCPATLNIATFPLSAPVIMIIEKAANLGNTISLNAWNMFGIQIDVRDKNNNGYSDQIFFDGYSQPSPLTWTTSSGSLTRVVSIPACTSSGGINTCITSPFFNQFEIASQAIVQNPVAMPFGLQSTPATQGVYDNAYQEFVLGDNDAGTYNFKQGFSFNFYGVNYTQALVSTNGYVSFGAASSAFPVITVNNVRVQAPRIMSFYDDLLGVASVSGGTKRIYAQQFCDASGVMKVRFVHEFLAEFGDMTGSHGGEIVITDNDDIAVFVPGYQGAPSINTVVGITPGLGIDPNVPGFGRDLSALSGTMTVLNPGRSAFELFDHGPGTPLNPIDLIGFANNMSHPVGRGIVFRKNPAALNTTPANSSYIVE